MSLGKEVCQNHISFIRSAKNISSLSPSLDHWSTETGSREESLYT